jgi:parvulin-like peptidyl-prolyl isomerase
MALRTAAVIVCVLLAAPVLASQDSGDVVAHLGDMRISAALLAPFLRSLDPVQRKQALADPELMNRLIALELARIAVLNAASAQKWQDRPDVARKLERARTDMIVSTYLASAAAVPKDYPSDTDIAAAYDKNRDAFLAPRQYRLQQIFVATLKGNDKKTADMAEAKANSLARLARAKIVDFAALARTRSEHKPSAEKGGDLGWTAEPGIVPQIREHIAGMELGDISDPIRTPAGWHIVRLLDTRPAGPKPLGEVKEQIAAMLRQKKLEDSEQAYMQKLLAKSPLAVNEARLKKLFESTP